MKFCTNCGAQVPEDAKFCTECGEKLTPAEAPVPEQPDKAPAESYQVPPPPAIDDPVVQAFTAPPPPTITHSEEPEEEPMYAEAEPPQRPEEPAPQPAYEPVQPAYEAPREEPQPAYEAPREESQPAYEAPREEPQPAYEAPREEPQPAYEPPAGAGGFPPASDGKTGKPGSKKGPLIAILALVALVIIGVVIAMLAGGKSDGKNDAKNPNLGRYEAITCTGGGEVLDASGDWLELKSGGKAVVCLMGEEYEVKWELDGAKLTVKQGGDAFDGTLKGGEVTLQINDMTFLFRKEGAVPQPTRGTLETKPQEPAVTETLTGYWVLNRVESDDPEESLDPEFLAEQREKGAVVYMECRADGTGYFYVGEIMELTWNDTEIALNPEDPEAVPYTIKDHELVIVPEEGTTYYFRPEDEKPDTSLAETSEMAGYWTLLRIDSDDPVAAVDEETVEVMKSMNMEYFLDLQEDGTGAIMMVIPLELSWGGGTMSIDGVDFPYTLEEDLLKIDMNDVIFVFVPGEGEAPEIDWDMSIDSEFVGDDDDDGEVALDPDWWEGDWYGWWVVRAGTGAWAEQSDWATDTCARIEVNEDRTGYIEMWDARCNPGELLAEAELEFDTGTTPIGYMAAVEGYFRDCEFGYCDWVVDPELSIFNVIDHMICIEGYYESPENVEDSFAYYIFLRPWGMDWEDVRGVDYSDLLYEDMMPVTYDEWYVSKMDGAMPDYFEFD